MILSNDAQRIIVYVALLRKLKINVVLAKENCTVAIEGKEKKSEDINNATFELKKKLLMADLLLILDDPVYLMCPMRIPQQICEKS